MWLQGKNEKGKIREKMINSGRGRKERKRMQQRNFGENE